VATSAACPAGPSADHGDPAAAGAAMRPEMTAAYLALAGVR